MCSTGACLQRLVWSPLHVIPSRDACSFFVCKSTKATFEQQPLRQFRLLLEALLYTTVTDDTATEALGELFVTRDGHTLDQMRQLSAWLNPHLATANEYDSTTTALLQAEKDEATRTNRMIKSKNSHTASHIHF